jgi:hypothetical protein
VQSVRKQSYDKLLEIYKRVATGPAAAGNVAVFDQSPAFTGAFGISTTGDEIAQMKVDRKGALDSTTQYGATLARNACHFAPESWHAWEEHHRKALDLARQSYQALHPPPGGAAPDAARAAELRNEALLQNGFGDHYLQDSYAGGHLINKTQIMQMYVRWQDQNAPYNKGWATPATWRSFQEMAYNQPGLADAGQYTKAAIGTRQIGNTQVSTARNPQSVENTQSLAGFDWQQRFQMLGLRLPAVTTPGTPEFKLLVWLQRQRGGLLANRYDLNYDRAEILGKANEIGITAAEVTPAIQALLNANILYKVGAFRLSESRQEAGTRLGGHNSTVDGSFTLRKEWVVSVTGGREAAFAAATTPAKMNAGSPEYETMGKAAVYGDYIKFLQDAYLQKATNALHDYFCERGVNVVSDEPTGQPVFKVYGDNNMLNRESARGLRHSATTANMSRDAILAVAQNGQEPPNGTTQDILDRLPSQAELPPPLAAGAVPLALWHATLENSGWLGTNVFAPMNAAVNAVAGTIGVSGGGSLGDVTRDHPAGDAF